MINKKNLLVIFTLLITIILNSCKNTTNGGMLEVNTQKGIVKGIEENDALYFKSIPFAKPPVGQLRFEAPVENDAWNGVLDCTKYKASAMQNQTPQNMGVEFSEDCLYLNIIAPKEANKKKLPVYVWIHGGAFAVGSPNLLTYTGSMLAQEDIIQINITYRLGVFGFFTYQKGNELITNAGLKDLIMGLQWVKNNVASFGGDTKNITVGGESAGAILVSELVASPKCKGLFNKAIVESGSVLSQKYQVDRNCSTVEFNLNQSLKIMNKLNATTVEIFKEFDASTISSNYNFGLNFINEPEIAMFPTIDNEIILNDVEKNISTGKFNKMPLLIGFNTDDGDMFIPQNISTEEFKAYLNRIFGEEKAALFERTFPVDANNSMRQRAVEVATMAFRYGSEKMAQANSKKNKTYVYRFDFVSKDPILSLRKAGHALELPFAFNNYLPFGISNQEDIKFGKENVNPYWINFIKNGNPNIGNKVTLDWQQYNNERKMINFNFINTVIDSPNQELFNFFDKD